MQVTITLDDALATQLAQQVGDVSVAVQRLVEGWAAQVVDQVQSREGEGLRDLWRRLPQPVRQQIRVLVAPYREPPPSETPADQPPEG